MSDMAEMWKEHKEERQLKRESNLERSRQLLVDNNIQFKENANGHFIIMNGLYDFWATTGLFIRRSNKARKRGVRLLIAEINRFV